MALELTSVSDLKTYMGISVSTYDTVLGVCLAFAERYISQICDRRDDTSGMVGTGAFWLSGAHTENRPGALQETITLRYWPVTTITSVSVFNASGSSVAVSSASYRLDQNARTIRFLAAGRTAWDVGLMPTDFPYQITPIETNKAYPYTSIVYTGGFTAGSIPQDLSMAAMELGKQVFLRRKQSGVLSSETLGNYSWTADQSAFREWMLNEFAPLYLDGYYKGIGGGVV